LAIEIAEALAWTWRSAAGNGDAVVARRAADALAADGPGPAWRAFGRICATSRFLAHDPAFSDGPDGTTVLADPECAGVAMALFAPDPTLETRAVAVLQDHPGAFWPLIAAGRAALKGGDARAAQHLGLVASGTEPDSIYPQLLLAYAALARGDDADLAQAVARGLARNPDHGELLGLQAVVLVHRGDRAGAQRIIDRLGAGHLQFHLQHRVGHPMERTVDALVQAHLVIPAGSPDLPPLVPGDHRDLPP
jgi:hypothetical protein